MGERGSEPVGGSVGGFVNDRCWRLELNGVLKPWGPKEKFQDPKPER